MKKKELFQSLKVIALALILGVGVSFAAGAWEDASGTPPENNAPRPVNVSDEVQTKVGDLHIENGDNTALISADKLAIWNGSILSGLVEIGSDLGTSGTLKLNSLTGDTGGILCASPDGTVDICGGGTAHGISVFDSSGTFDSSVIPDGASFIVELWGGGGGGAGNDRGTGAANSSSGPTGGGGGDGGDYTLAVIEKTSDVSYTVTVGAKGARGLSGNNGSAGGESSFIGGGVTLRAKGGGGGLKGLHSSAGTGSGSSTFTGSILGGYTIPGGRADRAEKMLCLEQSGSGEFEFKGVGGHGGSSPRGGPGGPGQHSYSGEGWDGKGNVPGGGGGGGWAETAGGNCDNLKRDVGDVDEPGYLPLWGGDDGAKGRVVVIW